jgi:hypothetical protein
VRPEQLARGVPDGDVGGRVLRAGVADAMRQRHRLVGGYGEDPHKLLEIRPVLVGEPIGDGRGLLPAAPLAGGRGVEARELDRGGVVVKSRAVDVELHHRTKHEFVQHTGLIGVEQTPERPAHPVVVQVGDVGVAQSEPGPLATRCPVAQRVQRLMVDTDVPGHDEQGLGPR